MFAADLLASKTILITGGGSGLGAAMAQRFAELGASLVLAGRREHALQATADAIRAALPQAHVRTQVLDIRDPQAVASAMDQIAAGGLPNVLVNNAAATFIAQTEQLSARAADAILGPTLHGALPARWSWVGAGLRHKPPAWCSASCPPPRSPAAPSPCHRPWPNRASWP